MPNVLPVCGLNQWESTIDNDIGGGISSGLNGCYVEAHSEPEEARDAARPVLRSERILWKRATKGSQLRLTPIDKQSKTGIIRLSTLMLID